MERASHWKMFIKPRCLSNKQGQEVTCSCKSTMLNHLTIFFNETPFAHTLSQKHLGMYLDEKLNFNTHIKKKIAKANKGVGMICKLAHVLPS